jgi:hypothetical protein
MRLSALILAGTLILVPLAAFGGPPIPMTPGALEFSATGGASVPFGDFNSYAEPGFGVGGQGAFYVMPNLALGGSIFYNSYGVDEIFDGLNMDVSIWELTGHGKYLFMPGPFAPYAKGSVGVFRSRLEAAGVSSSVNDLGLGGGVGAQLRLPASNIGLFVEGMSYVVFTEVENTTYYAVRAGINYYVNPTP